MLSPLEVAELVYRRAEDLEHENINSIDYWCARFDVSQEDFMDWIEQEIVCSIKENPYGSVSWEHVSIFITSSFLQGMIFGSQLNTIGLEIDS